jgi:hypothetical protein
MFPVLQPESEPEPTSAALDEAAFFASRERRRGDARLTHLHRGGLVVFWVSLFILLGLLSVWAWHILTPDSLHFLSAQGIEKLQTVLISVLGSSFVSGAARRWIGSSDDKAQPPS